MDKELLERAKQILISDYASEEEIIYVGYLINMYIDNSDLKTKIHLNDVCFFIENRIFQNERIKNR